MKKSLLFCLISLCINSCISSDKRGLASQNAEDMLEWTVRMQAIVNGRYRNNNCEAFVENQLSQFSNLSAIGFLNKDLINNPRTKDLIQEIWKLRLIALEKFRTFENPSPRCVKLTRRAIRYMRFAEEAVILNTWTGPASPRVFGGGFPQLRTNPNHNDQSGFQSGDVFMVRGKTFISATIARIGDEDAQFSHVAMVFEHSNGIKYVVESLIETGVTVTPLKKWLDKYSESQSIGRITQYRVNPIGQFSQKEMSLCAKAAYTRAVNAINNKNPVPYDFTMDLDTSDRLFCSEVVSDGCRIALKDNRWRNIPVHKTTFNSMNGHPFLTRMQVSGTKGVFSPADMEVDPNFRMISEWVNPNAISETTAMDAAMTSVLTWMSRDNFDMEFGAVANKAVPGLYKLLKGLGFKKLPKDIPKDFLKSIYNFLQATSILKKESKQFTREFRKENGFFPFYQDYLNFYAKYRKEQYCHYIAERGHVPGMKNAFTYVNQIPILGRDWAMLAQNEGCP